MKPPTANPFADTDAFVAAASAFVTRHGGPCYRNWSPETLQDYFRFHLRQHTLAWCRDAQGICGVLVAWQTTSARLDAVCPTGGLVFDWTPNALTGDVVWVADVVTTQPGALFALAKHMAERFPHWPQLPAFTYRRGYRHFLPTWRLLRHARKPNPNPTGG